MQLVYFIHSIPAKIVAGVYQKVSIQYFAITGVCILLHFYRRPIFLGFYTSTPNVFRSLRLRADSSLDMSALLSIVRQ